MRRAEQAAEEFLMICVRESGSIGVPGISESAGATVGRPSISSTLYGIGNAYG
jgi:hypothetical protein